MEQNITYDEKWFTVENIGKWDRWLGETKETEEGTIFIHIATAHSAWTMFLSGRQKEKLRANSALVVSTSLRYR